MEKRTFLKGLFAAVVAPASVLAAPAAAPIVFKKVGRGMSSPIFMIDEAPYQRGIVGLGNVDNCAHSKLTREVRAKSGYDQIDRVPKYFPPTPHIWNFWE